MGRKICCIGDIHGTDKFLDCYDMILKNDNDCEKIIVFGDHFDPYKNIHFSKMVENYNKFLEISKKDKRIISLLGNHDLSYYIIRTDKTNRTTGWRTGAEQISRLISINLSNSYLCYRIGDYLFSHAGVSETWFNGLSFGNQERMLLNCTGWTVCELYETVKFYNDDMSYCGDDVHQGCTWIRPESLIKNPLYDYNQVVAHTRITDYQTLEMSNGKKLYMIDTCGESNYLTLEI